MLPPSDEAAPSGLDVAKQEALDFVKGSPTYGYDGIEGSLSLVRSDVARCPGCYVLTFQFRSRQAGYGDRTGKLLAQVITDHEAVVVFSGGEITQAILDDAWDMLTQSLIER